MNIEKDKLISKKINCDVDPLIPFGWIVDYNKIIGEEIVWSLRNLKLYHSVRQTGDKVMKGIELLRELKNEKPLNASVLDVVISEGNQHLIFEKLRGKRIFFFGTIYSSPYCNRYVRYMCEQGKKWKWDFLCLDEDLGKYDLAICFS